MKQLYLFMRLPERELIVVLMRKNHLFIRKENKKSIIPKAEKKHIS